LEDSSQLRQAQGLELRQGSLFSFRMIGDTR
jgi:hypothetical protein